MRFIYPARSIISFLTKFCQKRWNTPRGSVLQRQYNLVSLKALFNQHMIYFFIVQQDYPQYLDEYGKMFIEFPRLLPQAFLPGLLILTQREIVETLWWLQGSVNKEKVQLSTHLLTLWLLHCYFPCSFLIFCKEERCYLRYVENEHDFQGNIPHNPPSWWWVSYNSKF